MDKSKISQFDRFILLNNNYNCMNGQQVVEAFECGESAKSGNYESDGKNLYLFGNLIAKHEEDDIFITLAGWNSVTTKRALNFLHGVSISSRQGVIKYNDKIINSTDFYKVE